jgi:hypothetical protein
MGYGGSFGRPEMVSLPAKVDANPCRVEIAYRLPRSDPAARAALGFFFPCRLNRFGAYVCASHADGAWDDPPRRGYNARFWIRRGILRLDRPPARRPVVRKLEWVRRYPVDHGYIVPFDGRGRLREGLELRGPGRETCATFASIRQPTTLLGCGAGFFCFVPKLPVRDGQPLACPEAAGSRVFYRGRLTVLPEP